MRLTTALSAALLLTACGDTAGDDAAGPNNIAQDQDDATLAERSLDDMAPLDGAERDPTEYDDIEMEADTRYSTYYLAGYAPAAECEQSDQVLELESDEFRYGETSCKVGSLERSGNGIRIKGRDCRTDGVEVADREYEIALTDMQTLEFRNGPNEITMERCGTM